MPLFRLVLNALAITMLSLSFGLVLCFQRPSEAGAQANQFDPATQSGVGLFYAKNFKEAAKILEPLAKGGDLEALALVLVIRQNGLDGTAPAADLSPYNNILAISRPILEERIKDKNSASHKMGAYHYGLARIYYFGLAGEPKDAFKAERMALKAASFNFTPALNLLVYMDDAKSGASLAHTKKAADKNDPLAMHNLGLFHLEGRLADQDDLKAAQWFRKSCDYNPGLSKAQNAVGFMYATGRGVTQDLDEAQKWFKKASAQGYAVAAFNSKLKKGQTPQMENAILY